MACLSKTHIYICPVGEKDEEQSERGADNETNDQMSKSSRYVVQPRLGLFICFIERRTNVFFTLHFIFILQISTYEDTEIITVGEYEGVKNGVDRNYVNVVDGNGGE